MENLLFQIKKFKISLIYEKKSNKIRFTSSLQIF